MNHREATAFGKAVGDPTRQRILKFCCCDARSVSEIATHVGVKQPTATHHLSLLLQAGLVNQEKRGKHVFYTVNQEAVVNCCGNLMLALAPDQEATQSVKHCC